MNRIFNNLAKIFFSICLLITISFTSCAYADGVTDANSTVINEKILQTKVPTSKRQIAYKFLLAMLGVATSSVIIFVLLSLYNKFMYSNKCDEQYMNVDDDYRTPTSLKEALTIFLKKTK